MRAVQGPASRSLLLAIGLLTVAAPAASAEFKWLDAAPLSADGSTAAAPAAASSAPGEVVAAWQRTADGEQVEAAIRGPGGSWSTPQTVAPGASPRVGIADDGTAILAWISGSGPVMTAIRAPGGAFGAIKTLDDGGTDTVTSLDVAVNGRGDAVLSWRRSKDGAQRVHAVARAAGADFGGVETLGEGCEPDAAIGSGGHGAVVFHGGCAGLDGVGPGTIRLSRRAPGGGFATADVGAGASGSAPSAAVDGEGNTLTAWHAGNGTVRTARVAVGGGDPVVDTLAPQKDAAATPQAGYAPNGDAIVAWLGGSVVSLQPLLATAPKGQPFGHATMLHEAGTTASSLLLSVGGGGAATAVWLRGTQLQSAQRRPDGSFLPGVNAAANAGAPSLATDDEGNALGLHVAGGRVQAQGFDGAGPTLYDVSFPGVAEATKATAFSAKARDRWSGVASQSWDFGDGTTGPGADTTHVYTSTGVKTYAALASDTLGNSARFERQLFVFPLKDRTPPVISGLSMDRRRFKVGTKATAITAAAAGTRFRYTISEPASAAIFLEKQVRARRRGKRCVKVTSPRARGRSCKKYEAAALLTRKHPLAGKVSVGFTGRLSSGSGLNLVDFRLEPGRYRALVQLSDAAKNVSNRASITFTVTSR